jgi:hypothetical protein
MSRWVFTSAVAILVCSISASPSFAQAKPAPPPAKAVSTAPTTPAPAAPAKWVAPVKGLATIDLVEGTRKVVGKEIVTTLKVKNTSTGSINLLKVDQLWYDKKRAVVSSAQFLYRKPFLPGEIVDVELRAPLNGVPDVNQMTFAHANGNVKATKVKAF